MLYGNRYRWKASLQDMTGKQIANAAEKNEHHVRCPNICRNEMIFVERLGALIIHSSSKQEYTVRAAPQILCSLNLYTLWLFLIHIYINICIIDISKPLTFWFFDMFWFCLPWNYCDCRSWNLFWWFWLMCFTKMKTEKTKLTLRFNEAISKWKEAGLCHTPTTFANTSTDFPPDIPFTMSLLLLRQPHLFIDLICLAKRSSDPSTLHVAHLRHPKGCQVRIFELTRVQTSASRKKKRSSGCQGNVGNS